MSQHKKFDAFEEKLRRMADGFRSPEIPNTQLIFRGEEMLPMQVAQRLQGILDSFQGVRDAESGHRMAQAELERAMPHHAAFYEETVEVAKSHFGSDPRRLASFGLEVTKKPSKRRRRVPTEREVVRTTVVEEVMVGPGRRPEVEVIATDTEVVETADEPGGRRRTRPHAKPRRGTSPVSVPGAPMTPAATPSKRSVRVASGKGRAGR